MILEVCVVPNGTKKKKASKLTHKIVKFRCDNCGVCSERKYNVRFFNRRVHYCSHKCSDEAHRRGGTSYDVDLIQRTNEKIRRTCQERYGVDQSWQAQQTKDASKRTLLERYGVDNAQKIPSVREKSKVTCRERYGCEFAQQSEIVKKKARQTFTANLGVDHPFKSERVKEKMRQTNVQRRGVPYAAQDPIVKERIKQTNMTNSGVCCPFLRPGVDEKRRKTNRRRYDTDYYWQSDEFKERVRSPTYRELINEGMKRNGSYSTSKPENALYVELHKRFDNVERQRLINGWPIDFYIKDIDTYVQLDGIYWHGLDRPLEEIKASGGKRDKQIVVKWHIDRKQDAWFKEHGLRLVRVTDVELYTDPDSCLAKIDDV